MFFSLNEIVLWIGLTLFEIWINLVSVTIFSVLLALKIDGILTGSWWVIFSPLFISDALNAYFCVIIFIRMSLYNSLKISLYRASWSAIFLGLTFVFKFLLCKKLTGQSTIEYSEVFAPLFILLQFIAVRACQLHQ
ncbi:transmembrane protein 203 [Arctopsyche grandis]|uniref:transmembrane protein 203 n=1 Tax=Arctopsyche grandis TaxID=121162 RepID=UPI00406D7864